MLRMRHVAIVAVGLLAVGGATYAQDDDKKDSEFVLLNKYRESVRAERWKDTIALYEQLRGFPVGSGWPRILAHSSTLPLLCATNTIDGLVSSGSARISFQRRSSSAKAAASGNLGTGERGSSLGSIS